MNLPDFRTVQPRAECTEVPQGISLTETDASFYIRIRIGDHIVSIRVRKEDGAITLSEDFRVETNPENWHGIWGTKG